MSFVHLNTRSDYSALLSTVTPKNLINQAYEYQMPGMALTDVGNLYGAIELFSYTKSLPPLKNGNKFNPIIGMSVNVIEVKKNNSNSNSCFYKLILLAETMEGYRNLCRLSTFSYNREIPNNPTVDLVLCGKPYTTIEEVIQYAKGCIVLTAGSEGEIFQHILHNRTQNAMEILGLLQDGFGKKNIFIEIQNHSYEEERKVNRELLEIAKKNKLPLVATNQVCYLHDSDRMSWDILYCIGEKRVLVMENNQIKPNQFNTLSGEGYHLRSTQEMEMVFSQIPEALSNTLLINDRCQVDIIEKKRHMPIFPLEKRTPEQYLKEESYRQLQEKHLDVRAEYRDRLNYELSIIEKMNFASYFIIVADFINYARKKNIMVGAGRGSAAGSLISYVMGITSLDPIAYGLYFERFLNPERISFPDIDIDFQDDRRDEVIEYVRERYGEDHVSQIVSFSKLKSKAVFKDVARVFGVDFETSNKISKLIKIKLSEWEKEKKGSYSYLEFNYQYNIDFSNIINSNPVFKLIYEHSLKLENLTRQTGIHAAGIVIADKPLIEYIPLLKGSDGEWATQFDGSYLETYCGLLKIDFLGITALTVLQRCVDDIKNLYGKVIDIAQPPLNDKKTFSIFSQGLTGGVFQFESDGMTSYLKDLRPEDLKELTAMNALYRPGPMAWIPVYIARKHGRRPEFVTEKARSDFDRLEKICRKHEALNKVLNETRGIPFYQEQIMEICKVYAGFTLGAADNVRKAMGKKDKILIQKLRSNFVEGAVKRGSPEIDSEFLYDEIIIPFAGYGFNKSHSACYAYLAYQTAYLKANFPICFMVALFNSELEKSDSQKKLSKYLDECFFMDIEVYPPDINYSDAYFVAQKNHIVYGLAGIKNIGISVSNQIVEERKKNGKYQDPIDFLLRHSTDRIGKLVTEALVKAGCFDFTGYTAERWLSVLGEIQERLEPQRNQRHTGQLDLFEQNDININEDIYVKVKNLPFVRSEAARWEKDILGFNLRYEPIFLYRNQLIQATTLDFSQTQGMGKERSGYLGCIIRQANIFKNRNGKEMAKFIVSDGRRNLAVVCFEQNWEKIKQIFPEEIQNKNDTDLENWLIDKPSCFKLWIKHHKNKPTQLDLFLDSIEFLDQQKSVKREKTVWIKLISNHSYDDESLMVLKTTIKKSPGPNPVKLVLVEENLRNSFTLKNKVDITPTFKISVSQISIVESVRVTEEPVEAF